MDRSTKAGRIINVADAFGFDRVQFSSRTIRNSERLIDGISDVNSIIPEGWPVGYEKALLSDPVEIFVPDRESLDPSRLVHGFDYPKSRDSLKIELRPAVELCLHSLWRHIGQSQRILTIDDLVHFGRLIDTEIRYREIFTSKTASGHRIRFSDCKDVMERLEVLVERFNEPLAPKDALRRGAEIYINFLIIHPFRDGNGFSARAFWQLYLNHALGLKAPIIPLSQFYYQNTALFQYAYLAWALSKDGDPLLKILVAASAQLIASFVDRFNSH